MSFCLRCTYAADYDEHDDGCSYGAAEEAATAAEAGAYWLGMLGFALAAPAATERAAQIVELLDEYEPIHVDHLCVDIRHGTYWESIDPSSRAWRGR